MKKIFFYISLSLILGLVSCSSPSYFLPAAPGSDISYLPKPMSSDTVRVKNYLSASLGALDLPYSTGELTMGFLNLSRAHTTKNMNFAYGAFAFAGGTSLDNYNSNKTTNEFDGKSFYGGGLRSSIGLYDVAGNAEFRLLSWENALSFENGSYADFRRKVKMENNPDTVASTKTTIYTTGLASEIIWHPKRNLNNHFAFRLFYGFSPGLRQSLENNLSTFKATGAAVDFAFYFKLNKFYGIYNTGGNKGFTSKFSLGYTF